MANKIVMKMLEYIYIGYYAFNNNFLNSARY